MGIAVGDIAQGPFTDHLATAQHEYKAMSQGGDASGSGWLEATTSEAITVLKDCMEIATDSAEK
jgi:hypothetical protein